ncbi:MAG: AAA domain-containing protein, partial [Thaumarchaeota archaeon]|nr:AAA domain-containing protein [Nitrososphaerota archaeon]
FSLSQEPFIWATQGTDPSTKAVWERLQPGDVVFVSNSKKDHGPFHSEKVILAIGICVKKFMGTQPYWQDEKEKNKVIYDYRFELKLFRPIPSKAIQFNSIGGLPFTKGFNAIANEENIKQLLNEISINWSDGSSYIENITFHQSFSYEEFLEGIKPKVVQDDKTKQRFIDYSVEPGVFKKLCMRAEIDSDNTYAMIIDEINRGNISKIFGELITIIENDKRGDEVTLSYSGEKFSVPDNVYVIGTMNTADQSLTQIDAALKRRFSTVEVMPDSSILEDGMNGLKELLDAINSKIREKRSRDNQIGHAYFMYDGKPMDKIKDLRFAFATDVIPVIRDYFYADEDELRDVLSDQFINWNDDARGDLIDDWQDDDGKFKVAIKSAFHVQL